MMKNTKWRLAVGVLSLAIGATLPVASWGAPAPKATTPASTQAAPKPDTPEAQAQKILDRPIPEMNFSATPLVEVMDHLRDATGLNMYIEWNALRATGIRQSSRITYKAEKVKGGDAIKAIFKPLDDDGHRMAFGFLGKTLVITTPDSLRDSTATFRNDQYKLKDPAAAKLLNRELGEVVFKKTPFRDAIDILRETSGAEILVAWDEFRISGISRDTPVNLTLHGIPFWQALRLLMMETGGSVPIEFTVEDGKVLKVFVPTPQ